VQRGDQGSLAARIQRGLIRWPDTQRIA